MSTFVSVGTCHQSFSRMLTQVAVLAEAGVLPRPVYVQHGHTPFASTSCEATAFLTRDEFELLLGAAGLVIVHAGVTALQAVRAGKVPVVIPRHASYGEHIDDHQRDFARGLEASGLVVVANEPDELASAIDRATRMQFDAEMSGHSSRRESPLVALVSQTLAEWEAERNGVRLGPK